MSIRKFTRNQRWGVCVYKTPYVKNRKVLSPGIIMFNKIFLYKNPKRKDTVNPVSYKKAIGLDSNLWVKGIYNSGPLCYIKKKNKRWRGMHETTAEDWEKFDFAMPFNEGIARTFSIPFSLSSFVDPEAFKPLKTKKEFDLCLIDWFEKKFKTQLILARAVKLYEKKYKKKLGILFLGEIKGSSKAYRKKVGKFLKKKNIKHRIGFVDENMVAKEINKCKINITLRDKHGSPRALTETASCNLPQIITDGFYKNVPSYFFHNMVKSPRYKTGVTFKHNNVNDLCRKIKYVLDNLDSFSPREYILKEENYKVSRKKLEGFMRKLFESKGMDYKYLKGQIFTIKGTSFNSFYNADLKTIENLTKKIVYLK